MASRRLCNELKRMQEPDLVGITAGPISPDNMYLWHATIAGPEGSPYAGGIFHLSIEFPQEYPLKPMTIMFETKIYHPCINAQGKFIMRDLEDQWGPASCLEHILQTIQCTLDNPSDIMVPIEETINAEFETNRSKFNETASQWTRLYAQAQMPLVAVADETARRPASRDVGEVWVQFSGHVFAVCPARNHVDALKDAVKVKAQLPQPSFLLQVKRAVGGAVLQPSVPLESNTADAPYVVEL